MHHFAYVLHMAVHDSTGKAPAELFLSRKIIRSSKLDLEPDLENSFVCQDVDTLLTETQSQISNAQKWQAIYSNMRRRQLVIKVGDFVLLEKHR